MAKQVIPLPPPFVEHVDDDGVTVKSPLGWAVDMWHSDDARVVLTLKSPRGWLMNVNPETIEPMLKLRAALAAMPAKDAEAAVRRIENWTPNKAKKPKAKAA